MPKPKKKTTNRVSEPVRGFASASSERSHWENPAAVADVDWSRATRVRLPKLKATTTTISLRMPGGMLDELKVLANKRDVPYQSLLKIFLAERLEQERKARRAG